MCDLMLTSFPIIPSHKFYDDGNIAIGLSRYPTTPGHTIMQIKRPSDLFSQPITEFVVILTKASEAASILSEYYAVKRCALVTEGGNSLIILPLHGLKEGWEPVLSSNKEFNEVFPGYVSSLDGPMLPDDKLEDVSSKIQVASGTFAPFNLRFEGPAEDSNLFARIIRGEIKQWRIWEDDCHIAFLTPFANTPGFTVLVPRKHLSSDIFSIHGDDFTSLMKAAHTVANLLKQSFGISRCGMIFEGFEIDYAHVKLMPILQAGYLDDISTVDLNNSTVKISPFYETYQGHVSSLNGPSSKDFEALNIAASSIRGKFSKEIISAPRT